MNIEGAEDMGAVANPLYDMHAAIATPDGDIYSASQPSADSKKWSWKCFVASSQGERFQVHWWLGQPKAVPDKYKRLDLRATVYIDGVKVEQRVLKARDWLLGRHGWMEGQQVDKYNVRHFQWGLRELLDDDTKPNIQLDLNTIRVVVEWGGPPPGARSRQVRVVPRRWRAVRARLGDTRDGNTSAVLLEDPVPFEDGTPERPMFRRAQGLNSFTFTFKYASQEWLDAKDIVLHDKPGGRVARKKRPFGT